MRSIVDETAFYTGELLDREHRGFRDSRERAVERVARKTGLKPSYINRIRYRAHEMTDVAGSAYRALRAAYEAAVAEDERKALILKAAREAIDDGLATDAEQALAMVGGLSPLAGRATSATQGEGR